MKKLILGLSLLLPACGTTNMTPAVATVQQLSQNYMDLSDTFRQLILDSTLPAEQKNLILDKIDSEAKMTAELYRSLMQVMNEVGGVGTEQMTLLNAALDAWIASKAGK